MDSSREFLSSLLDSSGKSVIGWGISDSMIIFSWDMLKLGKNPILDMLLSLMPDLSSSLVLVFLVAFF